MIPRTMWVALDRVAREQRASLAAVARREGLGADDAVDCVHDALCTFLQRALEGTLPANPEEHGPLLAGIVAHLARNKRRRHHLSRPHAALDAIDARNDGPPTDALVAHAEERVRLRACIDRLCERQRSVVMMRLLEERPGDDVASALGVGRGYVDVLLHRAKAALAACMADET